MLRINEEAPNFTAETSQGTIKPPRMDGRRPGHLVLGLYSGMAGLEPEFEKRNCKIIGLSADPVSSHSKWAADIEETQGHRVNCTGRNFDEILRVLDSMQLTARHKVATPVNWKQGGDVIILPSVSDAEAQEKYPDGWKAPQPICGLFPSRFSTHVLAAACLRARLRSDPRP